MIKKVFFSLLLAFMLVLGIFSFDSAFASSNDAKIVVSEGEAAIISSEGVAEQSAVSAALRNAVEQTTGVYVQSDTKVKNFQVLSDEIYTKASGYVSGYEVVSKKTNKDSVWVKVKATVTLEPLFDTLKKLGLLRKWTVAVVLAGGNKQEISEDFIDIAKTQINNVIIEDGFRVVEQNLVASLEQPNIFRQMLSGNYLAASKILRDNGVDVLIVGKVYSNEIAGNNMDAYGVNVFLGSAKGRIEASLVRADTGELLSSKSFEGMGVGAGKDVKATAIKNVAFDAGKYLSSQIMKLPASTSAYIQLSIKGLSFSKAKEFSEAVKNIRGVRKVTSRGFRDKEAMYEIETDGDVNLLADNLSEDKTLKLKFKFDITTVSSGKIEASGN